MHLGIGNSRAKEAQQLEARESRRLFKESIRTDWNYPSLPAYRSENDILTSIPQHTTAGFRVHQGVPQELLDQVISEVTDWKERYYGSSDSEAEESEADKIAKQKSIAEAKYMFEGPDSVGEQVSSRTLARKSKRQKLLGEEMQWNDGLAHFINRRDLWTGARTASQIQLMRVSKSAVSNVAQAYNASLSSSPRSSTSINTDLTHASRPSTATTSPDPTARPQASLPDMMIPTMSQLLTSHPVRKKIGPSMYSEIYSKIILQSRTPAVPINLLPLIRALVHGWKSDGEWPPKPSVPEPSITRKKAHGIKQGVKAVTRVLKITSADSSNKEGKKPG